MELTDMDHSMIMLDCAIIWSKNRDDGIGKFKIPDNPDYMEFLIQLLDYFELELEIGQNFEYAEELLLPLFPSIKNI